jgi:hypothetical protein
MVEGEFILLGTPTTAASRGRRWHQIEMVGLSLPARPF